MRDNSVVSRLCAKCGKFFLAPRAEVNRGNGKYCGRSCASNAWKPEGLSRTATRRRARRIWMERHGGAQPVCHCGKPADVHHKDGNPLNNAASNHEPLCRSHHTEHENEVRRRAKSVDQPVGIR